MRMSRFQKFRKRKKLVMISKFMVSGYIILFTFGYLASGTGAYFNAADEDKQVIQAGTWWDGSELIFTGKNTQNVKSCPPEKISATIKNKGFSMIGSTEYKIYYAENGNPKNNGKKIAHKTLQPIEKGETASLRLNAEKEGSYMFEASQRSGYQGDNQQTWSEKIMVKCKEKDKEDKEKDKEKQDKEQKDNNGKGKQKSKEQDEAKNNNKSDKQSKTDETNESSESEDAELDNSDKDADDNNDKQEKNEMPKDEKEQQDEETDNDKKQEKEAEPKDGESGDQNKQEDTTPNQSKADIETNNTNNDNDKDIGETSEEEKKARNKEDENDA